MKSKMIYPYLLVLIVLFVFIAPSCPVPVFQYALEFWESDPYRLTIFYRGSLTPSEQEVIDFLHNNPERANIEVRIVDIEGDVDDMTRVFYEEQEVNELPWLVVQYPEISWRNEPVWSGPFGEEVINGLLQSPQRQKIAEMLVSETTAVWVLLESGNMRKDREAKAFMEQELRRLEQTLALPDPELWWDGAASLEKGDLPEIRFDMLSVSKHSHEERFFWKMLLQSEDGLDEYTSEPMIIPIYGRGIALWAIIGSGINEWNVGEAAEFLTGPCSCQVKMLNPGVDILMSKDWANKVTRVTTGIDTPLTGMSDFEQREEEVRKELELETSRRFREETDPEKVVYLDLSFDNESEEEDKQELQSTVQVEEETDDITRSLWIIMLIIFIVIVGTGLTLLKISNAEKGR